MMLSAISHSMPPSFPMSREHLSSPTMAASLAILPQRQPSLRKPESLVQRPKLQINTTQLRTFGKGSSLRLDTLSAVSPTARNTFSNAYEAPTSAAPALSKQLPTLITSSDDTSSASTPSSACTPLSSSTSTSTDSATISIPYKQPHNLNSILSNSPARPFLPRKMAPSKPMFSVPKRVSFRTPLEEEIKTEKYTMAHSDIESSTGSIASIASTSSLSSESAISPLNLSVSMSASQTNEPSPLASPTDQSTSASFSSLEGSPGNQSPRTGEKRDSSSSESDSEDSCPETPVAGRRKRRREWRWTLGPLDKSSSSSPNEGTGEDSS